MIGKLLGMGKNPKVKLHTSTYGLIFFFLLLPFEYPMLNFGMGSILRYVGILVMGFAAYDFVRDKNNYWLDYRSILMFLWLAYAFFSVLWSVDEAGYNHFFSMYRNNALMFLFVTIVKYDSYEADLIKKSYIAGVALLILYMTFVPGAVVQGGNEMRLTLASTSGEELIDHNYLIAILSMPYGFVMYRIFNKSNDKIWVKMLEAVFCIMCLYYTFMSGSRSGLIALALITVLCGFNGIKRNFVAVFVVVAVIIVAIPLIIDMLPKEIVGRFSVDSMTGNTKDSGSRTIIWNAALDSIEKGGFFFGNGAGSAPAVMDMEISRRIAIHNHFLGQLVELGIIGLVLFTPIIIIMLVQLYKSPKKEICFAFVGIMIEMLFLDVLIAKFFWGALMMLTIHVSAVKNEEKSKMRC